MSNPRSFSMYPTSNASLLREVTPKQLNKRQLFLDRNVNAVLERQRQRLSLGNIYADEDRKLNPDVVSKRKTKQPELRKRNSRELVRHESLANMRTNSGSSLTSPDRGSFSTSFSPSEVEAMRKRRIARQKSHQVLRTKADLAIPEITPLQRFRHAVKIVMRIIEVIAGSRSEQSKMEQTLKSFSQVKDEYVEQTEATYCNGELKFDRGVFRKLKEAKLNPEGIDVMTMRPEDRTEEHVHTALLALNQAVPAFGEYPRKLQKQYVRRGWYERVDGKRQIIREGHTANNFYFIVSGTIEVTQLRKDPKTGIVSSVHLRKLGKGTSFGELALMHHSTRTATITSLEDVELLAVGREDFVDIFMPKAIGKEPEHIQFLRTVELLRGWPMDLLPHNDVNICMHMFHRRGVVICNNSQTSEWLYIVKSGSCKVMKAIFPKEAAEIRLRNQLPGIAVEQQLVSRSSSELEHATTKRPNDQHGKQMSVIMMLRQGLRSSSNEDDDERELSGLTVERLATGFFLQLKERQIQAIEQRKKEIPVFIEIQTLGPRSTLGFDQIAFELTGGGTPVSLVSEGAECIQIKRSFFRQHLTDQMQTKLRQEIQPYPAEDVLIQRYLDLGEWNSYKRQTFKIVKEDHCIPKSPELNA